VVGSGGLWMVGCVRSLVCMCDGLLLPSEGVHAYRKNVSMVY